MMVFFLLFISKGVIVPLNQAIYFWICDSTNPNTPLLTLVSSIIATAQFCVLHKSMGRSITDNASDFNLDHFAPEQKAITHHSIQVSDHFLQKIQVLRFPFPKRKN